MPTVLRKGLYRLFCCSDDGDPREPPHIHAATEKEAAEFLPEPAELEYSKRLHAHEFRPPHKLVARHQARFSEAWHAHFES